MDSNPDSDHLSHVDCDPDSNPDLGPGARVNAATDSTSSFIMTLRKQVHTGSQNKKNRFDKKNRTYKHVIYTQHKTVH